MVDMHEKWFIIKNHMKSDISILYAYPHLKYSIQIDDAHAKRSENTFLRNEDKTPQFSTNNWSPKFR